MEFSSELLKLIARITRIFESETGIQDESVKLAMREVRSKLQEASSTGNVANFRRSVIVVDS